MKKTASFALVGLFALSAIGAKDCDPWKSWSSKPPQYSPSPECPPPIGLGGAPQMSTTGSGGADTGGAPPADPQADGACTAEGLGTYIRCVGLTPWMCSDRCAGSGAICASFVPHPFEPGGTGSLKQCMKGAIWGTCTYCYPNGDVCSVVVPGGVWACSNTGGRGCE